MTDIRSHRESPSTEVAFDHYPKETELGVYFAERSLSSEPHYRTDGERELWEIPIASYWIIAAIVAWLSFCAGLVVWFERPGPSVYGLIGIVLVAVAWIAHAVIGWFNREARKLNPLLVLDRARGELHIAGRVEPLPTSDVIEIIAWDLSSQNERDLVFDGEQTHGQVSALLHRDARWQLVLLYHGGNRTYLFGQVDPTRRLATSLNVPFRKVDDVEIIRDLRPPDRFFKRFDKRKNKDSST